MNDYKYNWEYGEPALEQALIAEEEALDRTATIHWETLAQLEAGLQRMNEEEAQEAQQHAAERAAALAHARAKAQSLQQQLRERGQFRVQQWHNELQRMQAELAAAPPAARERLAARLSAMQQRQAAAAAEMRGQFAAHVAALQAQHDKLAAQAATAQAGAKAGLEQHKQEVEDDLARAQHDLELFNSATAAALSDLQHGRAQATSDLAAARQQALSEYHAQAAQLSGHMHQLQEQLDHATGPARDKIAAQIAALKQQRAAAGQKMSNLLERQALAAQARLDKAAAEIATAHAADLAALQADVAAAQADFDEAQRALTTFAHQTDAAFTDLDHGIVQAHDDLVAGLKHAAGQYK